MVKTIEEELIINEELSKETVKKLIKAYNNSERFYVNDMGRVCVKEEKTIVGHPLSQSCQSPIPVAILREDYFKLINREHDVIKQYETELMDVYNLVVREIKG